MTVVLLSFCVELISVSQISKVENGVAVDFMYFVVFVGFGEKVENGENRENLCFSLFLAKDFVPG